MFSKKEWIIILVMVGIKLTFHFLTSGNYELHRDALLYVSLGDHPGWGYASVPPSIGILANISRFLFGDSLFGIRFFPAIAGGLSMFLVALLVREFGGKSFALLVGCTAYLFSVAYLRTNSLFQPVAFNQFYWLLSYYLLIRLVKSGKTTTWIWIGVVWGLAILNKYSIAFFALAAVGGMLISDQRKLLFNWHFLTGMTAGFLIFLPNLIWQYNHNWPVVRHLTELRETQLVYVNLGDFIFMQFLMNAHALLVWIAGLIIVFTKRGMERFRFISYSFFLCLVILMIFRGKAYYTLGLYPVLFAAGAVALEDWFVRRIYFLRYVAMVLIIGTALPFIPLSAPLLPQDRLVGYSAWVSKIIGPGLITWEDGVVHEIPQDFADMTGWKQLADITTAAFNTLSQQEKEKCMIYAPNYGRAAAISFYGKPLGLPEPVSFNDAFLLWAPDEFKESVLIYVDRDTANISNGFESIELYGKVNDPYFRENGIPVYICRGPNREFTDLYKSVALEQKAVYKRDQDEIP